MLTHFEVTLRLCVATCVHAQMIDKLMNWYMCITPVSPIASTNMKYVVSDEIRCFTDCIDEFDQTTNTKITAICSATKKTCVLDPLPANQLTDNITRIVPAITRVTNTSLDEGVMPKSLKHAIVRPLLKKPSLDKDTLSSYRPVSNLTQLSKVIEKVVALRIMTHISDQQMVECFQSAYRKNHSTETAMLYVTSAVKTATDKKQGTILLLVDFISASMRSTITS